MCLHEYKTYVINNKLLLQLTTNEKRENKSRIYLLHEYKIKLFVNIALSSYVCKYVYIIIIHIYSYNNI